MSQIFQHTEPPGKYPSQWADIPQKEQGKYLFRWYVEEGKALIDLASSLGWTTARLADELGYHEIQIKEDYAIKQRLSRLETYWAKATLTEQRTTCLRRGVAAVLINSRRHDVLYSFNGPPAGDIHCTDVGTCKKDIYGFGSGEGYETCVALHAEQNLICEAAAAGISTESQIIMITARPCAICYRLIRAARFNMIICPVENGKNLLLGQYLTTGEYLSHDQLQELI